ncbi:MAG: MFS transporter [Candidatus Altiarchaeota archaeon]|nr:MFS transporter [Candidatus Altiarchaeota archaeon]
MDGKEGRLIIGVSANVFLLGIVSFLTDMSSEIITPILPFFITALGGAGLIIGLVGGLADSISSLLNVFSGYLSDRSGKRKVFIFSGYGLSSLAKLLLAFSASWIHVLILKPLERVGKGLRSAPRDAIIADSKKRVRGKSFGIHRAMDSAGAIIGAILALVLIYAYGENYERIILIAAFIGFLALIPLAFVKEGDIKPKKTTLKISLKALPKEFRLFLFIVTVFALGNFTNMFFILRAEESFTATSGLNIPFINSGITVALALYVWFNIVYTLFAAPVGVLSDRIGRKRVLIMGYILFGVTCLGFALFKSFIVFVLLFALYGLFSAFTDATQRAYASDLITEDLRGTALGAFHTSIALATLPSGIIAGALWQYLSPEAAFLYGSGIGFIATIMLTISDIKQKE